MFCRIFSGYNKYIRIFDTCRAGKECVTIPTVCKNKGKAKTGQFGLISCFASNPNENYLDLFAAGSYSGSIGLYSEKDTRVIDLIHGHNQGITCVSPIKLCHFLFIFNLQF